MNFHFTSRGTVSIFQFKMALCFALNIFLYSSKWKLGIFRMKDLHESSRTEFIFSIASKPKGSPIHLRIVGPTATQNTLTQLFMT